MPARDVEIDPNVPDPVLFSYANTKGGKARLRVVLVKIWSKAGCDSSCKVSVYVPSVDGVGKGFGARRMRGAVRFFPATRKKAWSGS
jgi:hypothetical protein